jgi:HK97 family phage major capsid protein
VKANAKKDRDTEITEILAIAAKHNAVDLARKYISEGKSKAEFVEAMLREKFDAKPVSASAEIGMSAKEKRQYSLLNAIRGLWQSIEFGAKFEGLEKEASDTVAKLTGKTPGGFFIPEDMMTFNPQAAMQVGDATKGGFTVGTDVLGGELIELLRNKMFVSMLGAKSLTGLVGNIAIPRVTGGATAYWLPETGQVSASDQAFGQIGLTPHRLVGDTAYTKELLMQSSISVEAFIREDLMRVLAIALDLAAINGSGSSGQPVGILNTTGIGAVTFGAAATWAKVVDFETQVANANADVGSLAYLTTPAVRGKWKGIVKFANTASPLWEKGSAPGLGEVNGYTAAATKQVPSDRVIYGNFADLLLASWAGIDVVIDPYSLKKSGQIEITITNWADIGVRHAGSFCASSDSGAQ